MSPLPITRTAGAINVMTATRNPKNRSNTSTTDIPESPSPRQQTARNKSWDNEDDKLAYLEQRAPAANNNGVSPYSTGSTAQLLGRSISTRRTPWDVRRFDCTKRNWIQTNTT
jgi:hypothetical protein